MKNGECILEVKDLYLTFNTYAGKVHAARGVNFSLNKGETLAIVGESGSGKSVTARAIMGLLPKNANIDKGEIIYKGRDLIKLSDREMTDIRGSDIAMIFQEPMSSLDPVMKIGRQITEALRIKQKVPAAEAKKKALRLMEAVGIDNVERRYNQYPFQFSGGMRQRIVIATALACDPEILICDEPTTALDVTVQAKILELIKEIQKERNLSVIFITHDLGVVANMADRVAVMYAGKIIEYGTVDEIFKDPRHPYTMALLSAMPDLETDSSTELYAIPGAPPNLLHPPKGDAFAPRNRFAMRIDLEEEPPMFKVSDTHYAATWLLHEEAPTIDFDTFKQKTLEKRRKFKEKEKNNEESQKPILEVRNLKQYFTSGFGRRKLVVKAVDDISFDIYKGEIFGLVGESGCGKTTTGRSIIGLYEPTEGEIYFNGELISRGQKHKGSRKFTREISMIFQDPIASLNPRMTVKEIIGEGLKISKLYHEDEIMERVYKMLEIVGLSKEHANRYPHEFSGGQRQRIGIARALIVNPKLVIADEPISALDVSIQAQVLNLLNELKNEFDLTLLFIAHDLSVVKYFSDRIGVMYNGKLVEIADADELYRNPLHPYTKSLLSAIPIPNPDYERTRKHIHYDPSIHDYSEEEPKMVEVKQGHFVYGSASEIKEYTKSLEIYS